MGLNEMVLSVDELEKLNVIIDSGASKEEVDNILDKGYSISDIFDTLRALDNPRKITPSPMAYDKRYIEGLQRLQNVMETKGADGRQ